MTGQSPLSTGGTSGKGRTTDVGLNQPQLDPLDKKVLCSAICYCESTPNIGKDGQELKQSCVAQRLTELDKVYMEFQGRSPWKPEISYDMTKAPPSPILDSESKSGAHGWIPGWIKKY